MSAERSRARRARERLFDLLSWYYPRCIDDHHGGYVAQLDPGTGDAYDRDAKHLVATCRFVANFSVGALLDGPDWCLSAAERGVTFLREVHRDPETGGYDWLLDGREPVDRRRSCYGHAFVLLAYARAAEAGVPRAEEYLAETHELLTEQFYEPERRLFRNELDADWEPTEPYRGQNANMHACEAYLAAHEATGDEAYLERAATVARALAVDLAAETDGLVWEHYADEWEHDFAYNEDDPDHQFRPPGYQPGHHAEWAKLLAILDRHWADGAEDGVVAGAEDGAETGADGDWALDRAVELFDAAVELGWDERRGGFYYTVDESGEPLVADKYGWAVAEALGAAAALFERTGEASYSERYDDLLEYADTYFETEAGPWREKLTSENEPYPRDDGPAVEPDYHPIGARYEAVRSFAEY